MEMERNVITGISRFGRLRKVSTKLIDLPNRSPRSAKRTNGPPKKDLRNKLSPKVTIDPFVDFSPNMFDGLLVSEETEDTDTSSSVGECEESVVMWSPKDRRVKKQKICKKQKVFA